MTYSPGESSSFGSGVWKFHSAWKVHRSVRSFLICNFRSVPRLSNNGGDEDFIGLIPPRYNGKWPRWMEQPYFGCSSVDEYHTKDGWEIRIGAHA